MPLPETAVQHYARQQLLTATTMVAARRQWNRLTGDDLDREWQATGPRLLALLTAAQRSAAADGARYVPQVLDELGIDPASRGRTELAPLAGVASDGRPLPGLLREPVIGAKQAIASGAELDAALGTGLKMLERIVTTQVADAARAAAGVSITARPAVSGYVRMLNLPSCPRCVVLAGKHFRWNAGFSRHPRCDCRHIPANENHAADLTTDPDKAVEAGQVTGLSRADRKAIDDGADVAQVINAHRGMRTANLAGRQLKVTSAGTSRRRAPAARLRPESIYQLAADRDDAIRLLRRHGYLS